MHKIIVSKQVLKYMDKLPANIATQFAKQIANLAVDQTGYRCIGMDGPYELRELRLASHRVYYLVENGIIFVDLMKYDGKIKVSKAGTKDQQKRQIESLKREHGLREKPRTYRKSKLMTETEEDLFDYMIGRAYRARMTGDFVTLEELKKHLKL